MVPVKALILSISLVAVLSADEFAGIASCLGGDWRGAANDLRRPAAYVPGGYRSAGAIGRSTWHPAPRADRTRWAPAPGYAVPRQYRYSGHSIQQLSFQQEDDSDAAGNSPNSPDQVPAPDSPVSENPLPDGFSDGGVFDDSGCSPDWCKPRGTLLQWSYGTSFSGGPDRNEPLVTDRPDFTEASSTVGRGVLQIEMGYTYQYDAQDGMSVRSQSWGEPLFRYGMFAEWLEFRLGWFPTSERTVVAGRRRATFGVEDLYLGVKVALTPQEGALPEMALIPQTTIPTGSTYFTNNAVLPGVNWIYAWDFGKYFSTAGSSQINRVLDGGTGRSYLEFAQSWTFGVALTDAVGAYLEWYALIPHSADTERPQHVLNGGFTLLASDDVQFDVRIGSGINRDAPDFFMGTGLSIRFK